MSAPERSNPRVPDGYDVARLNIARIYDYMLDGKDNFEVDRAAVRELEVIGVEPRRSAETHRAFVHRAVRAVARRGVSQFIDLGSGLPTSPSVDEVAREVRRRARVAYVDNDPVVVAHTEAMLAAPGSVAAIRGDLRDPRSVAEDSNVRALIDFGQPVAILLTGVLHFIGDDENPSGILATIRDLLAPGSHLILSAATSDGSDPDTIFNAATAFKPTLMPLMARPREQIMRFFDGFELLRPGVVAMSEWRPDKDTDRRPLKIQVLCGVGSVQEVAAAAGRGVGDEREDGDRAGPGERQP